MCAECDGGVTSDRPRPVLRSGDVGTAVLVEVLPLTQHNVGADNIVY